MKNRKQLVFFALAVSASLTLTGCFGQTKEEEVVVEESTFPEVEEKKEEPTPVPTETPEKEAAVKEAPVYISANKQISIQLPDDTWSNKTDEDALLTFESPDQGSILITVASGDAREELSLPDSEQNAVAVEEAAQLTAGKDFEITGYQSEEDAEGNAVYSYEMNMLDAAAAGYANIVVKVLANETDAVQIRGTVKADDAEVLAKIREAVDSVVLSENSSLHAAVPMAERIAAAGDGTAVEDAKNPETADGTKEETIEEDSSAGQTEGITPSRDNPNNSDPSLTRTIYRNSDGYPIVISADSNGNWVDEYGNTYRFSDNDIDVYDQDDVDYYWHGEAADVYYMPVETEE